MLKYTCRAGRGGVGRWIAVLTAAFFGVRWDPGARDPGRGRGTRVQGPGPGPARAKNAAVSTVIHHPTPRRPALHVYFKT